MAEPNLIHGKNACLYLNGYNLSQWFRSVEFTRTKETVDATTFRSRGKRFVGGFPDSTITAEGLWDGDADAIDEVLDAAISSDAQSNWIYLPEGDTLGRPGYGTIAIDTSHSVSGSVDDIVATAIEAQPTVGRERMKILHTLSDETATGNDAEVDHGAAATLGGAGYLQVMEVTGTGSIDVTIESDDTTGFPTAATLITFASVTAARAHERIALDLDASVEQFLRAEWTITGFTNVKFFVGFHRAVVTAT